MAVCMNNLNITNWPLHEYGQQLARYYRHRLPLEALAQPPEALPRRLARAAAASGGGSGGGGSSRAGVGASSEAQQEQAPPQDAQQQQARQQQRQAQLEQQARQQQAQQVQQQPPPGEPAVLRVAFQKRSGDRLLLNAAELLDKCNAWRYTTAAGVQVRAHCWEVRAREPSGRARRAAACGARSALRRACAAASGWQADYLAFIVLKMPCIAIPALQVEIPDLIAGIGAAQAADVFVGSHGANMVRAGPAARPPPARRPERHVPACAGVLASASLLAVVAAPQARRARPLARPRPPAHPSALPAGQRLVHAPGLLHHRAHHVRL